VKSWNQSGCWKINSRLQCSLWLGYIRPRQPSRTTLLSRKQVWKSTCEAVSLFARIFHLTQLGSDPTSNEGPLVLVLGTSHLTQLGLDLTSACLLFPTNSSNTVFDNAYSITLLYLLGLTLIYYVVNFATNFKLIHFQYYNIFCNRLYIIFLFT